MLKLGSYWQRRLCRSFPFLDELEIRFQDEKDTQVEKILQQFGFVRGIGYLQSFAKEGDQDYLGRAAKAFGFFAEQFPTDPKAVMAMQKRTDCLRALHEWKEAARVIETLFDKNQPYRKQILKRSELLSLFFGRAQCYHIERDWVKGEPAFRSLLQFADAAKDEDRAAYAVSCLTEMFVQTKRIDEVFPLLPRLSGDTPARYDLRLKNVNLMQGAEQLSQADRHVEASLFYSLTMTTEEIQSFYTERQKRLQNELSRLEQFLALRGAGLPSRRLEILKEKSNDLAMRLTNANGSLKLVNDTPSFTTTLRWRKSDNFQSTQRDWEAFWGFYWLYKDFPITIVWRISFTRRLLQPIRSNTEKNRLSWERSTWRTRHGRSFRADATFIMANAYREQTEKLQAISASLQMSMTTVGKERAAQNQRAIRAILRSLLRPL